jgi:hypothetical protein
MYAQRFAGDTRSYINWVLDLELPVPGRRRDFEITAIYYRDNRALGICRRRLDMELPQVGLWL